MPNPNRPATHWRRLFAAMAAFGLIGAACGGDDGGGDDATGTEDTEVADAGGDPDEGEMPLYGGKVLFAREAETNSPWTPATMTCDLSCHQAVRTVYDTLTYLGEDDEAHPFLLESIEPNEDFTVWTLTAREGITFHDGSPFDADAIMDHFERMRAGFLVGRALINIEDQAKVDQMTVEITMTGPWTTFPAYLTALPGYVASPTWLAAVDAGTADATEPVGSGPFVYAEYNSGDNFRVTRNEDYWLSDAAGNQYPYLDEIEFLVLAEDLSRERALVAGDIDITHTDKGESILSLRDEVEAGDLEMYEISDQSETTYVMINVSDETSPVGDVRIRQAMALATNQELRSQARSGGIFEIADGPFPPGSIGHLDDNGWPEYDPEQAQELVDEFKADTGADSVTVRLTTSADPDNRTTAELLQQNYADAGIETEIAQIEQGELIRSVATGDFEAVLWRRHGGLDPELERPFWHSESAGPVGEIATNFGRIDDELIDEALDQLRTSSDPAVRQEGAEAINRRFAEQVYNVWNDWIFWAIPYNPRVHGVQTPLALPDGTPSATRGLGTVGGVGVAQLWVDDAQ